MEPQTLNPKFHIICDSRGAGLQKILANHTRDFDFTVTVISGAKLDRLINCACDHQETFDLQIIAGGICNITEKEGPYVSYTEHPIRLQSIRALISQARTTLGDRLLFCNVPSASIHKYNTYKHNVIKRRSKGPIVGAALAGLQDLTRRLTWGAPSAKLNETAILRSNISRTKWN